MREKSKELIRLEGIVKNFPGVKALKGVDFTLREGELHALCGENGAGKSTLIKILAGAYRMDEGRILFDGDETRFYGTAEAMAMGISCIYQELSVVPLLDAARNIYVGNLPMKGRIIDYKKMYADAEALMKRLGLDISPKTPAGSLSVGQQQMLEIARALTRKARVIIMDEPTSSLSEKEIETLFDICAYLKEQRVSIVYISHKLDEVMRIADAVTVIRDGENIFTKEIGDITREEIVSGMIGRSLKTLYGKQEAPLGDTVLKVRRLTKRGVFDDISFDVREGEILGFFGLIGAGRSEIMRAIFGAEAYVSGEVTLLGAKLRKKSTAASIRRGLALVSEDRKNEGLMLKLSVMTNMTLTKLRDLSVAGVIQAKKRRALTREYIDSIDIKTPAENRPVVNLSGGNQQKVVLAKWLMMKPRVLIIDEPTRGIDVGSKAEIYRLIGALAKQGMAVILVSSEIEEVMGLSDSIITIRAGKKTAQFKVDAGLTRERLLSACI
jgi:ribose transport system ATP-binding protein